MLGERHCEEGIIGGMLPDMLHHFTFQAAVRL